MKIPPFLKPAPFKILVLAIPLALFFAGWWFGLPPRDSDNGAEAADNGETWTCSMHPQIRQPEFGLCPLCNMDLIPLKGGEEGGLRELTITPEAAALLDIRVSPVTREPVENEVRLFGRIAYDERRISTLSARVAGRIDRLFVDFTGARVSAGDHLAEIFSPDMLVAQRELIEARRGIDALAHDASPAVRDTRRRLLEAARDRLRFLQFSEDRIAAIEALDQPAEHLTLDSPQTGVVIEKFANVGDYVSTGDPLFRIADLSGVWLEVDAYETDLPWLRFAQEVTFTVEAMPGREFTGRIVFINPEIDAVRRVARVRVNVPNADDALKPGMFARVTVRSATTAGGVVADPALAGKWISPMHPEIIRDEPGECDICGMDLVPAEELGFVATTEDAEPPLLIPASAVLRTGRRAVVYVRLPEHHTPTFEGREIVLGPRLGQRQIVSAGLHEGEPVVTRGAFALDSELQLKAKPSMMDPNAGLAEIPAHEGPESLVGQWPPIPRALHRLMENPDSTHIDIIQFLIESIETDALQPDELSLWEEFSRRLLNRLEEARQIADARPEEAAARVVRAVDEAGRFLGLDPTPAATPQADPEKTASLRRILDAYLPLAAALADDDDEAALQHAATLRDALADEPPALADPLAGPARETAAVESIADRRTTFKPLSDALIDLVRAHGIDAIGNAYVVHCPMAFGDAGADWLSAKPEVLNPYYGDRMLTCGTVTDTLSIEPPSE